MRAAVCVCVRYACTSPELFCDLLVRPHQKSQNTLDDLDLFEQLLLRVVVNQVDPLATLSARREEG